MQTSAKIENSTTDKHLNKCKAKYGSIDGELLAHAANIYLPWPTTMIDTGSTDTPTPQQPQREKALLQLGTTKKEGRFTSLVVGKNLLIVESPKSSKSSKIQRKQK